MKTTVQRVDLDRAIKAVSRAIPTRGPLPVLCNVKVKASGAAITLTGTDLEMSLTATTGATVDREGETLIPAKTLADIVAKLPEGPVTIDTDGSDTRITAGKAKFKLRTGLPAEFPEVPEAGGDAIRSIFDAQSLLVALRHVAYATANEDKAVICGVVVEQDADGTTLAATDGFRLSRYRLAGVGGDAWSIVVPRRAVDELLKQLASIEGEIVVYRAGPQLIVEAGTRRITTRLIDGVFPNYRALLPTTFERTVTVGRLELMEAVERVAILASDREASAINLTIGIDELGISAGSSEMGDSQESVTAAITGGPLSMWVNSDLVTTALRATAGERVVLSLNGPLQPVTLGVDGRNEWSGLVMPVNRA